VKVRIAFRADRVPAARAVKESLDYSRYRSLLKHRGAVFHALSTGKPSFRGYQSRF